MTELPKHRDRSARWRGALAGLVPALGIALLFAVGGTTATQSEVATSLALVTIVTIAAGWIAGPLAASQPSRILVAAFGYAIALIAMTGLLSIAQGVADAIAARGLDPVAILTAVIGRASYGLVSTAYLIIPAFGSGIVWSLVARGLMRLTGATGWTLEHRDGNGSPPNAGHTRDPRRLGLAAAGIIAAYAVVVAAVAAGAAGDAERGNLHPPEVVPGPLLLALLLVVPAAVAAIGAMRRSSPLLVAAGVICLGQSAIAFSGVTIPFVVPAFLLLAIGAQGSRNGSSRRSVTGGVAVVVLGVVAWVSLLGLTEPRCWVARTGPDGSVIYAEAPVPDTLTSGGGTTITLGPSEVGGGCGSAELTVQGAALAIVLGIGAIGMAALAATGPSKTVGAPLALGG